ncbi:MAG: Trp biosynthesis-associated membrane protein [Actinomycetales bacterium]|nr:Trp biosynthesis-associated membrane protein [Actinomycetales bacterium]
MSDPAPATPSRRGYAVALVLLVAGGALLLLAYGRVWVSVTVSDAGLPALHVDLTGHDLQPEGTAAALVALAGVAALVATRRVGRLVSGAVLLVVGLLVAARTVQFGLTRSARPGYGDTIASIVAERTGVDLPQVAATASPWWLAGLLGALLVAAGGAVTLLRGPAWPEMGRRYERADAPAADDTRAARPPESAWDQLDRGVDPTQHPSPPAPDTTTDPTLGAHRDA